MRLRGRQSRGRGRLAVFVSALLVLVLIGAGVAIDRSLAAKREFRIGLLTSLKMECGRATINAVKMAIAEVNAKGGVLGRKLKLFIADTESSPEKGITGLKRLVEKDKVHVLIGGASSGVVLACMDYLKRYNKVFMSTGVSSPLIAKKVAKNYGRYKYEFRTTINAINLAKSIIFDELALLVKLGYKRFAVLAEDAAWNRGLVGFLKKVLPKVGGQVVAVVRFDPQTADFAPVFSKIAASKAQVAIPLLAHTNTISLYKQWSSMKAPFRMAGFNNPGLHAEYWKKTGGACLSEVNVAWGALIRAKITRKTIPFFDAYVRQFKTTPHGCASTAYDGLWVLSNAARRAKSIKTGALIKALERTDYTGTAGRVVFDKKTHDALYSPKYIPFLITQWQAGGRWVILWPKGFATSKFVNPPWLK
ncbi:MAG: ABC transporter substrate-binding protein [Proteobacteria bacterium]|nr:ABC transporter substrate-binding protein [Pseudomonadota bacterium]